MTRKISNSFSLILLLLISSCASLVSRKIYPISLNSKPNNATVTVTDLHGREVFKGITPVAIPLKASAGFFKRAHYFVKFEKNGYSEKTARIHFKVDSWYWGNLLFGGFIGFLIVDPLTGAMYKLATPFIFETLTPTTANLDNSTLRIYNIHDIPDAWTEHLVLLSE